MMANTPQILNKHTNKWILRDSQHEYVIDWTKPHNQHPVHPQFSVVQLQKLLQTSTFISITKNDNFKPFDNVIVVPKLENNIAYLKVVENITILDAVFEYMFLFECSRKVLKTDELLLEKYNKLELLFNDMMNANKINTEILDIMCTTETNIVNSASVNSLVDRYFCNKDDMLKYHKFLITEVKCKEYINHWNNSIKNAAQNEWKITALFGNEPYIYTFGVKFYFYKFVDNYQHAITTAHNKIIRTDIDDDKLMNYLGVMFTYLSKYNKYDIINFKITRSCVYTDNNAEKNTAEYVLKLQYQYKINNNRDYFDRYYMNEIIITDNIHDIELVSVNNFVVRHDKSYCAIKLFKNKINLK